jgi:hypothetical protein
VERFAHGAQKQKELFSMALSLPLTIAARPSPGAVRYDLASELGKSVSRTIREHCCARGRARSVYKKKATLAGGFFKVRLAKLLAATEDQQ